MWLVAANIHPDKNGGDDMAIGPLHIVFIRRPKRLCWRFTAETLAKRRFIQITLCLAQLIPLKEAVIHHFFLYSHDIMHPAALTTSEEPPVSQYRTRVLY